MSKEKTNLFDDYDYERDKNTKEFDPIKVPKDGKIEAVQWSTKSLNIAVEAINKGLPLKANPFIGKNTKLLKPDLVYRRTKEEMDEYYKCMIDPIYFAEKCHLMTPEGLQKVKLRDYQVEYLKHLKDHRFSIFCSCRQSGKCNGLLMKQTYKIYLDDINNAIIDNLKKRYKHSINNKLNYIIIELPMFELLNIYCEQTMAWKIKYILYRLATKFHLLYDYILKIISIIDNKIYGSSISKYVDEYSIKDNIEVYTDTGFSKVSSISVTKPFEIYELSTKSFTLECADTHIVFDRDYNEVFVKDLHIGDYIQTKNSLEQVTSIKKKDISICMGDLSLNDSNHRFYSNGILSHNSTTTAIYCLWKILFSIDKNALILSKSGPAGRDLVAKIKDMYLYLPYYLKCGTMKWNQSEISFDNNCSITTEAFSPTAGLGKTINILILDEFAWCPPNDVELFYNNIIPTVTTISDSNVCIMSTQNGFNLFYRLYRAAELGKSQYAPFKVDWYQVPQYNKDTKQWEKRDEKWKEMMVGVLGSEEAFYYQYGTQFSASNKCLVSREALTKIRNNTTVFEKIGDKIDWLYIPNKECLYIDPDFDVEKFKTDYFIILCDLAEGSGNDYTVFNIIQLTGKDKFQQIGYWRSNKVDLKEASLNFWMLWTQLFNNEHSLFSIEWNTYGALFYQYLINFNNIDFEPEYSYRYINNNYIELDINYIIQYKKISVEDDIAAGALGNSKTIPGIKFTSGNKKTACAMLKYNIEKENIIIRDLETIAELENFEDKNGNGSYQAAEGHDDLIMTFNQIPMLMNTPRYKNFIEDYEFVQNNKENPNFNKNTNTLFSQPTGWL